MATLPLSILDLAPVPDGTTSSEALKQIVDLARLGDELGYTRLWYAEHHGMPSIASSSPEVLIATAAANTSRIHVGSGGVMLPNHVPLRVVETYRTLNGLYPGRIDLGIGRAGGSDGRTLSALRSTDGNYFPQEMAELLAFEQSSFPAGHPFTQVRVVPENVTLPWPLVNVVPLRLKSSLVADPDWLRKMVNGPVKSPLRVIVYTSVGAPLSATDVPLPPLARTLIRTEGTTLVTLTEMS